VSTAFDKIVNDRQLQDHWLRRLIAGAIDFAIIGIITTLVSFLWIPVFSVQWQFLHGVFFLLYAMFLESNNGATLGKLAMNLKVTTTDGKLPRLQQAAIRDVSKIHSLLWLIDTLIGMATQGDPHQKYSDRFAGTTVTSTIATNMLLQPLPQPQPTPPTTQI